MFKSLTVTAIALILGFTSCRKSDRQNDTDTQSSSDYLQAQTYFLNSTTHVFELLRNRPEIYLDADTSNHYTGSCPSFTITPAYPDSTTYPKTIILDFGGVNCTGSDGLMRRGKLNVVLNTNPAFQGTQITISPNGFFINDKEVRGGITLIREANTSTGHPKFSETVSSGEIHVGEGRTNYFNHTVKREQISGDTTVMTSDDEYRITGSAGGYATRGTNYSVQINTPYTVKPGCAYLQAGSATLKPGNLSDRAIEIGTGCDPKAALTIFGTVQEITFD